MIYVQRQHHKGIKYLSNWCLHSGRKSSEVEGVLSRKRRVVFGCWRKDICTSFSIVYSIRNVKEKKSVISCCIRSFAWAMSIWTLFLRDTNRNKFILKFKLEKDKAKESESAVSARSMLALDGRMTKIYSAQPFGSSVMILKWYGKNIPFEVFVILFVSSKTCYGLLRSLLL